MIIQMNLFRFFFCSSVYFILLKMIINCFCTKEQAESVQKQFINSNKLTDRILQHQGIAHTFLQHPIHLAYSSEAIQILPIIRKPPPPSNVF